MQALIEKMQFMNDYNIDWTPGLARAVPPGFNFIFWILPSFAKNINYKELERDFSLLNDGSNAKTIKLEDGTIELYSCC